MKKNTFHLISLGCAKNTVDSQRVADILGGSGFSFTPVERDAQYLIVNTCGFIQTARDEAVNTLNHLAKDKKRGQFLLAVGCMAERYQDEIAKKCPKVDGILGTRRITDILELIRQVNREEALSVTGHPDIPDSQIAPQGASAYLKIADGCSRMCAFCSIPLIKGSWKSRSEAEILQDAALLQKRHIKEVILIAQDTTAYGLDLGKKDALPDLISAITATIPDVPWLRILYAFPGYVSDRLIDVIAENPKVLPYLDIPLQHADEGVLKRMKRPHDIGWVRETVAKMREKIPGLAIRSTFITGFPNETDAEFQKLFDFLKEMKFDRVGVFPYSYEAGTASAEFGDTVPENVKQQRYQALMELQQAISHRINRTFIGKTLDVLVEAKQEGILIGRSYRDAPDVDGLVYIEGEAPIGEIVPVKIHSALEYDLVGKPLIKRR